MNCEVCGGGPHSVHVITRTNSQVEQMPSRGGDSRLVCFVGLGCREQRERLQIFISLVLIVLEAAIGKSFGFCGK